MRWGHLIWCIFCIIWCIFCIIWCMATSYDIIWDHMMLGLFSIPSASIFFHEMFACLLEICLFFQWAVQKKYGALLQGPSPFAGPSLLQCFFWNPFLKAHCFFEALSQGPDFLINCQLWKALLQGLPPPMPLRKSFNLASSSSRVSAEFPSHHCQQWGLALPLASASHPSSTPPFVLCRFHKKNNIWRH